MRMNSNTVTPGLPTCNCMSLIHTRGHSTLCRYDKPLTPRQQLVLELIHSGLSKFQIAPVLGMKVVSVESLIARTNKKLATHSVWDSVAKAKEYGLIV